jgi:uncharacterized SAM-binding protein YcdF (DUF218 family)
MFLLKKYVARFFLPVPICAALLLLGLILLWWTRKQKTGKVLVTAGTLLLGLLSTGAVADQLLGPLESEYPVVHNPAQLTLSGAGSAPWIIVLSGGFSPDPELPLTARPSEATLFRLIEGIRIQRQLPGGKLALSLEHGAPEDNYVQLLSILGVNDKDVTFVRGGRDTHDEARLFHDVVGADSAILVTSASHMARAIALFQARGMNPIPAPSHHRVKAETGYHHWIPSAGALYRSETLFFERLGAVWSKLVY